MTTQLPVPPFNRCDCGRKPWPTWVAVAFAAVFGPLLLIAIVSMYTFAFREVRDWWRKR